MDIFYLISIILSTFLFVIVVLLIRLSKVKKDRDKYKDLNINKIKEVFKERWNKEEQDFKLKKTELQIEEKEINSALAQLKTSLREKEKRYEEVNQDLSLYKKGKIKEIDGAAAEYEQRKQLIVDQSIDEYRKQLLEFANEEMAETKEEIEKTNEELKSILKDLEVERRKRAAINEEILRAKQIEEQQDFYRIQLDPNDTNDVEILRNMAPRLRHPEIINKVIWSGYYQKPLAELRKRLLPNGDKSGIYKITRIKTKELYIGQTTSFDRRFQDHVKTALGVGTLANSQFHKVMVQDGPENFIFEILEEVEKEKLKEREAYYIQWFKSDKFGLNSVSGVKNK